MKCMKCALYMFIGASVALIYKSYEKEITHMCQKMIKKEKEMLEDGLELE